MPPIRESVCRIITFAILLRYTGTPIYLSAPLAVLIEGCSICVTGMSNFIRQVTVKKVAPATAAASTITTTPRQTVSFGQDRVVTASTAVQTTDVFLGGYQSATTVRRLARLERQEHLERTPKSRVHQEILRKKRQHDAETQMEPTETLDNDIEQARLRKRYVKYRLKAAVEKVHANEFRRKYDDSELARHPLSKHVVALEKAAEEHGLQLEAAYQEQTSTLRTKCEAMFASFEEVRSAHQLKIEEHESLQATYERLKTQHDRFVEQVSRLSPWIQLLKGDASEWSQLRQTHSVFESEASATDHENADYQEEEAMLWSNHMKFDAAQGPNAQTFHSTSVAPQSCTSVMRAEAAFASLDLSGYESDEAGLEDERRAATDIMLTAIAPGKTSDASNAFHATNAIEVAPAMQASTKLEVAESKPSALCWSRRLVPRGYYDVHLAKDVEGYPQAATWKVHASICLEVGSDEKGRPRYFRFVPQIDSLQAERILPGLLHECQQKLMQYVDNNLVILAGLQVPSAIGHASLQFERSPSPGKPIWLRRGRKALPSVKPGARHTWLSKTSRTHHDSGIFGNPFDDCYALDSSVEPVSNANNA